MLSRRDSRQVRTSICLSQADSRGIPPRNLRSSFGFSLLLLLLATSTTQSFKSSLPTHTRPAHDSSFLKHALLDISPLTTAAVPLKPRRALAQYPRKTKPSQIHVVVSSTSNRNGDDGDYKKRRDEWANRYTNLDSLRLTFGSNRNALWGDLDAATARRLYKTLLPKALLELVSAGLHPNDLAPLAYKARVAAKLYSRERCQVPSRIACVMFDGFRSLKRYGKFQTSGMSYDQIWEKYRNAIMEDCRDDDNCLTDDDVTAKICLLILERSCQTNPSIDRWVLHGKDEEEREELAVVTKTLENDVRRLLNPVAVSDTESLAPISIPLHRYRALRLMARAKRRSQETRVLLPSFLR